MPEDMRDILDKFEKNISSSMSEKKEDKKEAKTIRSAEFTQFRQELLPKDFSIYERLCNISEKIIKIKPDPKKEQALIESIQICHLNISPTGVTSFALLAPVIIILFGGIISIGLFNSMFYLLFFLILGASLMFPLNTWPHRLADTWRMKASNQMVLCIFYVVTYMRHTSNLELAVEFAADHLSPPLSLDLKKVLWNIETEEYDNINESLNIYLDTWRKWNLEFIEAFNLCTGSLYETAEDRRLSMLDKSLAVILEETYEKMLHYAHNLKSPITMLHMLGVILPILGLVILPLIVSFMKTVQWHHIAMLYNVALPIGVYFLGKSILSKRPTGYGDTDLAKDNPELKKYQNLLVKVGGYEIQISSMVIAVLVFCVLFVIGMSPIWIHLINPDFDMDFANKKFMFLEYKENELGKIVGPYGLGATILSLAVPMAFGISIGTYYMLRSKYLIKIRDRAKALEKEFASGLFQLGSKLGDGLPAEIAFGKVADILVDTTTGNFFALVNQNITRLGMNVEKAIFDQKMGAINQFPSDLIESSMKVLIESSKRGPRVAAQALVNVAQYIKEIHRVNERLQDLLADIISSMTSQISFLTPTIAAIVIGITSMITSIIGKLTTKMGELSADQSGANSLLDMFSEGIPTFYFQIVVGIYVVQIVYILTVLSNGIQNGTDKLKEEYMLGVNMSKSIILYSLVALVIVVLFNSIAATIMNTI